ncbi:unnamed protein product, partial [Mesorhabditis belari]|uniref:Uncharacterized protein n=1 Tax=Mesorhabditis belari TaxID=2138241 RepID=A0AAF3FQS5_9BILA
MPKQDGEEREQAGMQQPNEPSLQEEQPVQEVIAAIGVNESDEVVKKVQEDVEEDVEEHPMNEAMKFKSHNFVRYSKTMTDKLRDTHTMVQRKAVSTIINASCSQGFQTCQCSYFLTFLVNEEKFWEKLLKMLCERIFRGHHRESRQGKEHGKARFIVLARNQKYKAPLRLELDDMMSSARYDA